VSAGKQQTPLPARWEEFLNALTHRLAKPAPPLLSTRCVTRFDLSGIFSEIRNELSLPSTFPTGPKILQHLVSMGLASAIPVELPDQSAKLPPSRSFVVFGIEDSDRPEIDPRELLQAYNQNGVICYFSALSHYNLTTQIPAHHHVATLTRPTHSPKNEPSPPYGTPENPDPSPGKSRLGSLVFSFGGVPFFSVKRVSNSIPGVKTRVLSSRTNIRITTIEQTLLDTLQYPYQCGGPEVVFESWERHMRELNEELLLGYLTQIQVHPLVRRVGAMLDLLGHHPSKDMGAYLSDARNRFEGLSETSTIPLLRGIGFQGRNATWNVMVP
jgi:hypothetical protein